MGDHARPDQAPLGRVVTGHGEQWSDKLKVCTIAILMVIFHGPFSTGPEV